MNRFAPILPELILTIGAIVLMMVAAFVGRRGVGARQLARRSRCCSAPPPRWSARRRTPGPCSAG